MKNFRWITIFLNFFFKQQDIHIWPISFMKDPEYSDSNEIISFFFKDFTVARASKNFDILYESKILKIFHFLSRCLVHCKKIQKLLMHFKNFRCFKHFHYILEFLGLFQKFWYISKILCSFWKLWVQCQRNSLNWPFYIVYTIVSSVPKHILNSRPIKFFRKNLVCAVMNVNCLIHFDECSSKMFNFLPGWSQIIILIRRSLVLWKEKVRRPKPSPLFFTLFWGKKQQTFEKLADKGEKMKWN